MLAREALRVVLSGTSRTGFSDQMAEIGALRDVRDWAGARTSVVPLKPNETIELSDKGMLTNPSPGGESRSGYIVDAFLAW
mgnify:CR=1 FL=1